VDTPLIESLKWDRIKTEVIDSLKLLLTFAQNPVQGMKTLPNWPWLKLLILMGAFAAACGFLRGIVNRSFLDTLSGLFVYPISTLMMLAIFSGLFYYIFLFFFKREVSYKKIFTHLIFATLPAVLLSTVSYLLPPITILGSAIIGLLLLVGFVENFQLPKQAITKLMIGLFLVYFIIWIFSTISFQQKKDEFRMKALPESLDILEKELGE
jgi:hypothetical protein